ncbi:hypothetical protein COY62_03540 [bacterium (Candidatus Howlettbacteria) CG_4_10_14_0_8_um_filter_40_9]|nr:MAG: hypothetical protein COY62_03540 [bacterium (Candidatus Howlettbacteria) CG_4_10_14_0_8_um_filter_40_9]
MAAKKPTASTQQHLDIDDIRDDIVILKNGNAVVILQTTAVNFDLLSEREQDAMIFAYAALLNSLTYPIQVLVRSKRLDISTYLHHLDEAKQKAINQRLFNQIELYTNFIRDLVSKNQVLDKRFYIVIPYATTTLNQALTLPSLVKKREPVEDKWHTLEKAKTNLGPKIEHLTKQISRIGVKARLLPTEELVEFFFDLYNADISREQKAALNTQEYTTPIVEPALQPSSPSEIETNGGSQ